MAKQGVTRGSSGHKRSKEPGGRRSSSGGGSKGAGDRGSGSKSGRTEGR
jgi:hypothetical protein